MDIYDPKTVFSSIDQMGRYAFVINQSLQDGTFQGLPSV